MTNIQNLDLIISELPEGVQPKVTVLRNSTKYKKSLFGVKSRVSGKNRKGQVAHGVGTMDNNMVMNGRQVMHNI